MPTTPPPKRHPYNQWAPDARALDLVGDKWTLLIVRDLAGGPAPLRGAAARAARHLDRAAALAAEPDGRRRPADPPALPRGPAARRLRADRARPRPAARRRRARRAGATAGRGARRARARPSTSARSCAARPGFAARRRHATARVEVVVQRGAGAAHATTCCTSPTARSATSSAARPEADAHVTGTQRAWIEALGPDGSHDELEISGRPRAGRRGARRARRRRGPPRGGRLGHLAAVRSVPGHARVDKLAKSAALKAVRPRGHCGFDPRPGHASSRWPPAGTLKPATFGAARCSAC